MIQHIGKAVLPLLVIAVILLAQACTGSPAQTPGTSLERPGLKGRTDGIGLPAPVADLDQELPATIPAAEGLPGPAQLDSLRSGSELVETLIGGSFTLSRSAGAAEQGDALLLDASASGPGLGAVPEWAVYGFDPAAAGGSLDSLQVLLDSDATGAWVGLGDFSAERWEWHGPYSSFKSFLVDDAKYLSPGGTLFISVVSPAGVSSTVSALSVRTINPNNAAPTADLQADVTSGNAPLTVSFDASASSDSDGEIIEYAWDFDGNGTYEEFSDGPQVTHVYASAGIRNVTLRVSDDGLARGTASLQISVNVAGNQAPTAAYQASTTSGTAPLTVVCDASTSSDSDGSIVEYAWDFDGNGSFEELIDLPQIQHTFYFGVDSTVWLRVTDDKGAQSLSGMSFEINSAPVASLKVLPGEVQKGESFILDGASSSDAEGPIQSYEWDTDGNGSFETDSAGESQLELSLDSAGPQKVGLRVTDNSGATATASETVYVRGWQGAYVSEPGAGGQYLSMAVVSGNPAIAFYNADDTNLYYQRASDSQGASWGSPQLLDANFATGVYPSMVVVNGVPAISYYNTSSGDLLYIHAFDANGDSWQAPLAIDQTNDTGEYTSLQVVSGFPAISYMYTTGQKLRYVRATDAIGDFWGSPVTVDNSGANGAYSCLRVVAGQPAISYQNINNADLLFVRAIDPDGSAWGAPVLVAGSGNNEGYDTAMTIVQGRPAISYYSASGAGLRYVRANDALGSAWGTPQTLTEGSLTGWYNAIQVVDGHPQVAFYNPQTSEFIFMQAADATGSVWGPGVAVFSGADSVSTVTLAVLANGKPALAGYNANVEQIGFARLY